MNIDSQIQIQIRFTRRQLWPNNQWFLAIWILVLLPRAHPHNSVHLAYWIGPLTYVSIFNFWAKFVTLNRSKNQSGQVSTSADNHFERLLSSSSSGKMVGIVCKLQGAHQVLIKKDLWYQTVSRSLLFQNPSPLPSRILQSQLFSLSHPPNSNPSPLSETALFCYNNLRYSILRFRSDPEWWFWRKYTLYAPNW